jgi:hypothetical protein
VGGVQGLKQLGFSKAEVRLGREGHEREADTGYTRQGAGALKRGRPTEGAAERVREPQGQTPRTHRTLVCKSLQGC